MLNKSYFIILLTIIAVGCEKKEIKKEVVELKANIEMFVVTKGAQNIKLGAVNVQAIPLDEYNIYLSEKSADREKKEKEYQEIIDWNVSDSEECKNAVANKKALELNFLPDLYTYLPLAYTSALTNSEGRCELKIPSGERWVIAATSNRYVGSEKEKYFWFVTLPKNFQTNDTLILSNNNVLTSSEDIPTLLD